MKLFTIFTLLLTSVVSMIGALPTDRKDKDVSPVNGLFERDVQYFCDDGAHWLGTGNCGRIWEGIHHLENNVGDSTLMCPGEQRCRWSCSYNVGLYVDNFRSTEYVTTGKGFAQEVRDIITNCRGGDTCSESNNEEYWFRGEKNYDRNQLKILVTHTGAVSEKC